MIPNEPLNSAAQLYHELEGCVVDGRRFFGKLPASQNFSEVRSRLDEYDLCESANAKTRELEVRMPSKSSGFFAVNMAGLIQAWKLECPKRFYVADLNFCYEREHSDPTQIPDQIQAYLDVLQLVALLKKLADHEHTHSDGEQHLVFLKDRKIELSLNYSADDLKPLTGLAAFHEQFIESEQHREPKKTIVRTALMEVMEKEEARQRVNLSALLRRFEEFTEKATQGYELYVSEFSFNKVRHEVEKEKLEFIFKLNKVFSDIQNQLLAVPLALVLVGSQMENTGSLSLKNIFILAGIFAFAIFMDLLIRNQLNTLEAIKDEVDHQWEKIEKEHKAIANRFKTIYTKIRTRLTQQRWLVRIVDAVVALSFTGTVVLWLVYDGLLPLPK